MDLNVEIENLKQNLELYKEKVRSFNQSVIDINAIKDESLDFNLIGRSIIFYNQKIKSSESLLNDYYNYKKI
jgi:uncharacterized protein YaaR (DUF327 family)